MRTIGTILAVLVLIGLVGGVGYGIYTGAEFLSVQWGSLSNDWRAILIVVGAILVACSLYVSWSIQSAMKRHGLKGAGRVQAYNAFIDWYSVLKNSDDEQTSLSLKAVRNQMMLWAGVQVAKQVNLLFDELQENGADRDQVLKKADHVYLEIKRDLGNKGSNVDREIL